MNVKTSYMMTDEVIDLLKEAEKKTGHDAMDLIHHVLRMLIHDHKKLRKFIGTVEYQNRVDDETGEPIVKHRVKLTMMKLENRLLQDLRRFCLKSISLLIAIAVKTYLSQVVEYYLAKFYEEVRDTYLPGNWTYKEKHTEEATCVTVWWGVPPDIRELIPE